MFALLPVHKPRGFNSRRVVDAVALATGEKVGHAGTLDPLAAGVLITAIGPATRLVPYVQRMPKSYLARFQLGMQSDSDDAERECRPAPMEAQPTFDGFAKIVNEFSGIIVQTPPAFSAVKINGRRAYRLAHRGREFTLPSREVVVHSIRLIRYEHPYFEIDVCCGRGTYIRSLGRDIAARLGTKCVMRELTRTAIGAFDDGRCAVLDDLNDESFRKKLLDPIDVFPQLPILTLDEYDLERLSRGVKYESQNHDGAAEILAIDSTRRLHAVLRPTRDGKWRPALNFAKYWRSGRASVAGSLHK